MAINEIGYPATPGLSAAAAPVLRLLEPVDDPRARTQRAGEYDRRRFRSPVRKAKAAHAAAVEMFGTHPDPRAVLQAMIDSSPGSDYRYWLHDDILLVAAKLALA